MVVSWSCFLDKNIKPSHSVVALTMSEAKALPDAPTDGVSSLSFLPSCSPLLASTSWDGAIAVHDIEQWNRQVSHNMESGPLLSLTVLPDTTLVSGGLD